MSEHVETINSSVINDLGVGLGHDSRLYMENVRRPQFCDAPVATWPATPNSSLVPSGNNRDQAVLGFSDPLARELYVPAELKNTAQSPDSISSPDEAWATSIVRVHEPIHAGLADQFTNFYDPPRLLSFGFILNLLKRGPHATSQEFRARLGSVLNDIWHRLRGSEFVQEALALREQRRFLERFNLSERDSGWTDTVLKTRWHRSIDWYLEKGTLPETDSDHPAPVWIGHALGDWLGEQILTHGTNWKIDPLDFAFRLTSIDSDFKGADAKPDSVLIAAASIPDTELSDLDASQQLQRLIDQLERHIGISFQTVVGKETAHGSVVSEDQRLLSPGQTFDHWRRVNYQQVIDAEDWYQLPLYATTYPGFEETPNTTLWDLLNGMAAETIEQDGQRTRRLWLESNFEWALGTPMLGLATQLWYLRDTFLFPIIRAHQQTTTVDVGAHFSIATAIANGSLPSETLLGQTMETNVDRLRKHAQSLHAQTPALQDRWETLLTELTTLGHAIYEEDEKTIAAFYRS